MFFKERLLSKYGFVHSYKNITWTLHLMNFSSREVLRQFLQWWGQAFMFSTCENNILPRAVGCCIVLQTFPLNTRNT